jgi:hypothetical protein
VEFREDLGEFKIGQISKKKGGEIIPGENHTKIKTYDNYDKRLNRRMMAEVLYHEVAHRAHFQRLPIGVLRRWVEIMEAEPVFLTSYIAEHRADPDSVDTGRADWEDFADSAATYMSNPGRVIVAGPQRFEFFNELIARYPLPVEPEQFAKNFGYNEHTLTVQLIGRAGDGELSPIMVAKDPNKP